MEKKLKRDTVLQHHTRLKKDFKEAEVEKNAYMMVISKVKYQRENFPKPLHRSIAKIVRETNMIYHANLKADKVQRQLWLGLEEPPPLKRVKRQFFLKRLKRLLLMQ